MFCKKCGNKMEDGAKFCQLCGTLVDVENIGNNNEVAENPLQPVAQPIQQPMAQPVPANNKKPNKALIAIIIGAIVAAIAGFFIITKIFGSKTTTIKMKDYISAEFSGYNGDGVAKLSVDYDKIISDNYKAFELDSKNAGGVEYEKVYERLSECIDIRLEDTSGMTNGEKRKVVFDIDENKLTDLYDIEIDTSKCEVEVEGLSDYQVVDLFENVTATFDGFDGAGTIAIQNNNNNGLDIIYNCDRKEGLCIGDVVTVEATSRYGDLEEYLKSNGYTTNSAVVKTFTVDTLNAYYKSVDDIPKDVFDSIIKQGEEVVRTDVKHVVFNPGADYGPGNWNDDITYSNIENVEYLGNYFLTAKDMKNKENNRLYMVYKVYVKGYFADFKTGGMEEEDIEYYIYVRYTNLMKLADGSPYIDFVKYEITRESFRYDSMHDYHKGGYTNHDDYKGFRTLQEIYTIAIYNNMNDYNYTISDSVLEDFYSVDEENPEEENSEEDSEEN